MLFQSLFLFWLVRLLLSLLVKDLGLDYRLHPLMLAMCIYLFHIIHNRGCLLPETPGRLGLLLRQVVFGSDTAHPADYRLRQVGLHVVSLHKLHQLPLVVLLVLQVIHAVVVLDTHL